MLHPSSGVFPATDDQCSDTDAYYYVPLGSRLLSTQVRMSGKHDRSAFCLYFITRLNMRVHKGNFLVCAYNITARPTCLVNDSWHKRKMTCPEIPFDDDPFPLFHSLHGKENVIPIPPLQVQFLFFVFLQLFILRFYNSVLSNYISPDIQ
jgi:hypothetical protein